MVLYGHTDIEGPHPRKLGKISDKDTVSSEQQIGNPLSIDTGRVPSCLHGGFSQPQAEEVRLPREHSLHERQRLQPFRKLFPSLFRFPGRLGKHLLVRKGGKSRRLRHAVDVPRGKSPSEGFRRRLWQNGRPHPQAGQSQNLGKRMNYHYPFTPQRYRAPLRPHLREAEKGFVNEHPRAGILRQAYDLGPDLSVDEPAGGIVGVAETHEIGPPDALGDAGIPNGLGCQGKIVILRCLDPVDFRAPGSGRPRIFGEGWLYGQDPLRAEGGDYQGNQLGGAVSHEHAVPGDPGKGGGGRRKKSGGSCGYQAISSMARRAAATTGRVGPKKFTLAEKSRSSSGFLPRKAARSRTRPPCSSGSCSSGVCPGGPCLGG